MKDFQIYQATYIYSSRFKMSNLNFTTYVLFICTTISGICGFGSMYWDLQEEFFRQLKQPSRHSLEWNDDNDLYLEQPLNHFDPLVQKTYQQRYWVKTEYWQNKQDGPVFLFIGGEGAETVADVQEGHHVEMAKKYGALLFAVEHRFYGKSINSDGLELENLQYLSSQQALADLATFYSFVSKKYKLSDRNKWVCFGGSYAGNLAAWFRIKYPNLVHAAVASSAPVRSVVDNQPYCNTVAASLADRVANGSHKCLSNVQDAFSKIDTMLASAQHEQLVKDFTLCTKLIDIRDINEFTLNLAAPIMNAVQANAALPGFPGISSVCREMTATQDPYTNLKQMHQNFLKRSRTNCTDVSWATYTKNLMNTTVDRKHPSYVGRRQWTYQTCTQFGYFVSCDPQSQCPFSKHTSPEFSLEMCAEVFGVNRDDVFKQVDFSNSYYGSDHPKGTRIVFVNGSLDPWHGLSIHSSISGSEILVFINGTSHIADTLPSKSTDLPALKEARMKIDQHVGLWLKENS